MEPIIYELHRYYGIDHEVQGIINNRYLEGWEVHTIQLTAFDGGNSRWMVLYKRRIE